MFWKWKQRSFVLVTIVIMVLVYSLNRYFNRKTTSVLIFKTESQSGIVPLTENNVTDNQKIQKANQAILIQSQTGSAPLTENDVTATQKIQKANQPILIQRVPDTDKWIITADMTKPSQVLLQNKNWNILQTDPHNSKCGHQSIKEAVIKTIADGARYIYRTDLVDLDTSRILSRFEYSSKMSALKYDGTVSNPLALHFHNTQDTSKLDRATSFKNFIGIWETSLVQKLVQPDAKDDKFQHGAPTLLLAPTYMSPFTFNNILFHYNAFWAIVPIKNIAVWSLWVQRMLHELNNAVSFSTNLNVVKTDECVVEQKLNISVIKNDLNNWQCKDRSSFVSCVLSLSDHLVILGYFSKTDYDAIDSWIKELLKHGYKEPKMPPNTKPKTPELIHAALYHPYYRGKKPANFKPYCPNALPPCEMKTKNHFKPLKILLVLVFNTPSYYNILPYLETVYRPYFKYILYCGQKIGNVMKNYNSINTPVSFVEVRADFSNGERGYQCLQLAMLMNYDVEGYLHMSDDVLLNMWNLHNIPTDKIWYQHSMRPANITQPTVPDVWRNKNWWPWASWMGHNNLGKAINDLKSKAPSDNIAKSFLEQLAKNAGGSHRAFYEVSDIFYIPQTLSKQFIYLEKIFYHYNVHLEIAVPTIINGLVEQQDIHLLQAVYLWYEDQALPSVRKNFNFTSGFLHPLKSNICFNYDNKCPNGKCKDYKMCRDFMCTKYLPCLNEMILDD